MWLGTRQQLAKLSTEIAYTTAVLHSRIFFGCFQSGCSYRRPIEHAQSRRFIMPNMLLSATPTAHDPINAHEGDYCYVNTRVYQQSPRLLLQSSVWYFYRPTLLRRLQSNRMRLRAWSLEPRSSITSQTQSHQCYGNFTGYRSASVSRISCHSMVYKCLHNAAPVYLSSDCVPVSSLAGRRQCVCVPLSVATWTVSGQTVLGRRAFRVCGPATWNTLPTELRRPTASATVCPYTSRQKTENLFVQEQLLHESALDDIDCLFCAIGLVYKCAY